MALKPGTLLGPHEIISLIGAGGMGEVYKARDTRLNRIVAIKTLPAHLAERPELRERFKREASTLANLKHAHICTLYDIGSQELEAEEAKEAKEAEEGKTKGPAVARRSVRIDYLVMEYLEGETLAERLKKGPLPLEQVLQYAIEISDALDKAHRANFTHRDIKPGNIMLVPQSGSGSKTSSKLLDFGLAKLKQEVAKAITPASELPTAPGVLTQHGTLLGTLQYMSPEQVEGKTDELDGRTDVFAFGAVVYEMATGKKAFDGKNQSSVIAKILEIDPPPMSTLQPMTPPLLDRVVKRCLAKDREERWQTAFDLWQELEWFKESGGQVAKEAPIAPRRKLRERLTLAAATLLLLTMVVLAIVHFTATPPEPPATRLSIVLPEKVTLGSPPVISPDGRKLAFVGRDANGQPTLWVRLLDALAAQPLPGTTGAVESIFWSPDSRFLGFFAEGKLKKIDITGGPPVVLCDTLLIRGGTWNRDGVILFGSGSTGIYRVAAAGGAASLATTLDPSKDAAHRFPQFLPDGDHFLFHSFSGQPDRNGIYLGSLNSRETRFLLAGISNAIYVPPGHILFLRDRTLMAQSFDAGKLQLAGEAFPIAEQVPQSAIGLASFSASDNSVLAYVTGSSALYHFVWMDRAGREVKVATEPVQFAPTQHFSLSPDEKRVAQDQLGTQGDIWLLELTRGTISRFTFDPAADQAPVWSADGNRLVFSSNRGGGSPGLYQKAASGGGKDELLIPMTGAAGVQNGPTDWSSDGRFLIYEQQAEKKGFDLFVLPLGGDRKPMPLLQSEFDEGHGNFSSDGKWIAYASTESGRPEVYVQTFPLSGGKWQISTGGGYLPMWRRDGKELFYVVPNAGRLMSVEVKTTPQFEASVPKFLFQAPFALTHGMEPGSHYAVSADGQRFLLLLPVQETTPSPITVVLNWTAGIKK